MRKKKKLTLKRVLKIIAGIIIFFTLPSLLLYGFLYFKYNEDLPVGEETELADILATKMLNALNHDAYKATDYIEFTFKKRHHYKWNKTENTCEVYWKNYKVNLDLNDNSKSKAFKNEIKIEGEDRQELIQKAVNYFNNDTFWLVAPYKVFDKGVKRSVVTLENNEKALLVTYTSGGSTPGDSYLWQFAEDGKPKSFKMWTSILPIDGLEASWSDWTTTETGAILPTFHKLMVLGLEIEGIETEKNEIELEDNDIKNINVFYIQKGITTPVSMNCGYIKKQSDFNKTRTTYFKIIEERNFLDKLKKTINRLSLSKEITRNLDTRISLLVYYKNKSTDSICLGESDRILLNGKLMNESSEFRELLKKEIKYENSIRHPLGYW